MDFLLQLLPSQWLVSVRQNSKKKTKVELIQLRGSSNRFTQHRQNTYPTLSHVDFADKACISSGAIPMHKREEEKQTETINVFVRPTDRTLCHHDKPLHVYGCSIFHCSGGSSFFFLLVALCLCRRKQPLISDYE